MKMSIFGSVCSTGCSTWSHKKGLRLLKAYLILPCSFKFIHPLSFLMHQHQYLILLTLIQFYRRVSSSSFSVPLLGGCLCETRLVALLMFFSRARLDWSLPIELAVHFFSVLVTDTAMIGWRCCKSRASWRRRSRVSLTRRSAIRGRPTSASASKSKSKTQTRVSRPPAGETKTKNRNNRKKRWLPEWAPPTNEPSGSGAYNKQLYQRKHKCIKR